MAKSESTIEDGRMHEYRNADGRAESMADQAQPVIFAMRYCTCLLGSPPTRDRGFNTSCLWISHTETHTRVMW